MLSVRPYTDADYDDFVRIDAATQSTAFWGEGDWEPVHPPQAAPSCARRYVAVDADVSGSERVVGYGAVLLTSPSNLDVMVHPDWQGRGVGTRLWDEMRRDLVACEPVTVAPWVRSDNAAGCAWLSALGFAHVHEDGPVQLAVADVDVQKFAAVAASLERGGVTLTTLVEESRVTPEYLARFYDLLQEVEQDVPGYVPENRTSYEQCVRELMVPGRDLESVFLAKSAGAYVGLSVLGRKVTAGEIRFAGGPNCLTQHLTGVRRPFRRRQIALALKVRNITYAQTHGYDRILSYSDNPAMRALNVKLGYRSGPWRIYEKRLGE